MSKEKLADRLINEITETIDSSRFRVQGKERDRHLHLEISPIGSGTGIIATLRIGASLALLACARADYRRGEEGEPVNVWTSTEVLRILQDAALDSYAYEFDAGEPVALRNLLLEARDTVRASRAEEGITRERREYREGLEKRLNAALAAEKTHVEVLRERIRELQGEVEVARGIARQAKRPRNVLLISRLDTVMSNAGPNYSPVKVPYWVLRDIREELSGGEESDEGSS